MDYRDRIERRSREIGSNIILALDLYAPDSQKLMKEGERMIRSVAERICGLKVNHPLILSLGLRPKTAKLVELAHRLDIPAIMDAKLSDVGHMNALIASQYFSAGFDAIIASPIIGWRDGLEPVFALARKSNKGVIILVQMSHKGADETFSASVLDLGQTRPQYEVFALRVLKWDADGMIIGATHADVIARVNKLIEGRIPIYAPGIGPQGGVASEAAKAGARYLIVGRSIYAARSPLRAIEEILRQLP